MKKLDAVRRFFVMLVLTVSGALAIVLLSPLFMPVDAGMLSYSGSISPRIPVLEQFQQASQNLQTSPGSEFPKGTIAQAEPAPTPGYSYVVWPGPDATGINNASNDKANYAASWPRINFTIRDPSGATGSSVAYVPNEFLVVSDRPSVSFEMRGGKWDHVESETDAYDGRGPDNSVVPDPEGRDTNPKDTTKAANEQGYKSPVYYEVYQLNTAGPQNGAQCFYQPTGQQECSTHYPKGGRRLGIINPRDANIFPAKDTNPGSQSCTGGSCWRQFSITQSGGQITSNGQAQMNCQNNPSGCGEAHDTWMSSGTFEGVDSLMRFNGNLPNLNGYYVFLVKTVHYADLDRGYVTHIERFDSAEQGYGCVNSGSGAYGVVMCPNHIRNQYPFLRPAPLLENGYFIRAANSPPAVNGMFPGRQYIATSPMNMALSLDWGLNNDTGDEMGDGPRGGVRPYYSMRIGSGGSLTRQNGMLLWNADWDSRRSNGVDDSKGDLNGQPFADNRRITAAIARPAQGWRQVIPFGGGSPAGGVSDNWADDNGPMIINMNYPGGRQQIDYQGNVAGNPFPPPDWQLLETQPSWNTGFGIAPGGMDGWASLDIRYWNHSNDLYLGGQSITTGQWPTSETRTTVNEYTPRQYSPFVVNQSGYMYNGRDSFTPVGSSVQSNLTFGFGYQTSNPRPEVKYDVRVTDNHDPDNDIKLGSWIDYPYYYINNADVAYRSATDRFGTGLESNFLQDRPRPSIPSEVNNLTVDLNNLNPNQDYYWQACAYPAQFNVSNCGPVKPFRVNKGPTATITSTPPNISQGGSTMAYRCSQLQFRLVDPEGHQVRASATATWDDGNGTNAIRFNQISGAAKNSGEEFSGDELEVSSWTVNGAPRTFDDDTTLSEVVNDLPVGTSFTLNLRGADYFGASDNDVFTWAGSSSRANQEFPGLGTSPGLPYYQPLVTNPGWDYGVNGQHKFGPVNTGTYVVQSGVEFENESKKEFLDTNGNVISTVADGQTVQVRTTIVNGGDSPAKRYAIKDYLGALRDFEKPTNVTVSTPAGGTRAVPASQVAAVVSDRDNADNDDVLTEPLDSQSADYRNGEWRIDIGQDGGPYMPDADLQPGQAVVIQYTTTANRNQNVVPGDAQQGDFSRKLSPSDTHFWVYYQEASCDANSMVGKSIDVMGVSVQAPFLRTRRGSIGSNRGAFGYSDNLSGEENATFLVQAGGNLSHFNAADDSSEIAGYAGQQTGCNDQDIVEGGVDWRTEMIKNIQKLNSGSKRTDLNQLLNPGADQGLLNKSGQANVWVSNGDLTINNPVTFRGVGTILVFGNLTINQNLTYAPDAGSINSLGIIVVGNITVAPSVTQLVGSYYALDSDPSIGADGCAVNVVNNRGIISTGTSSLALDVQGVMVARGFNFERFFVNPNDTVPDPAEDVYYDGRVLANTPPGFGTFRNTSAWYEIAP